LNDSSILSSICSNTLQ